MAQPHLPHDPPVEPVRLGRAPTYADIEGLDPSLRGEIVEGQLYVLPRPRPRHALVTVRLGGELDRAFGRKRTGPGGWVILLEPELHLDVAGRPIDPDLVGWRRERMPRLPETAAITLRPDWVCEVLSDSTHAYDRGPKMATYGRHGVPHAWLVDPDARTLEAYQNDAGTWRPLGSWRGEEQVRIAPFDAWELDLGLLWEP